MVNLANPEGKSLSELIADEVNRDPGYFAAQIVKMAQTADPTALKQVTAALEELRFQEDERLKFSNAQIKEIICLGADRIRGVK